MNKQHPVLSRQDIEKYIYRQLQETYWKFPTQIVPSTTFRELERYDDPDLIALGFLMDIEEDLGIYLPDDVVEALDDKDICVGALINTVARYSPAASETTPLIKEIPRNPRSVAERIVRWFIERFRPQESETFERVRDFIYQRQSSGHISGQMPRRLCSEAAMSFGGDKDVPDSARLLLATLDIFEALEEDADILTQLKTQQKEIVSLVRKRGIKRKEASQFVEHLTRTLETV